MMMSEENSNTLDLLTVKRAVYSWSIRFKSAGYGNEQLAMISAEYLEDLQAESVTLRQFEAAVRLVRRRCKFFPSMADILEAVTECRCRPELMAPAGSRLQIEEQTTTADNLTPEEIARNKERIKMIMLVFHPDPEKRVSVDEAVEFVESVGKIADFSTMDTKSATTNEARQ